MGLSFAFNIVEADTTAEIADDVTVNSPGNMVVAAQSNDTMTTSASAGATAPGGGNNGGGGTGIAASVGASALTSNTKARIGSGTDLVTINNGGHTQGDIAFMEAAVKDTSRFANTGGWGYFSFDSRNGLVDSAAALPPTASCYACHAANTAVDNTFVQFYPELFAIAKAKGTVKPTYKGGRESFVDNTPK